MRNILSAGIGLVVFATVAFQGQFASAATPKAFRDVGVVPVTQSNQSNHADQVVEGGQYLYGTDFEGLVVMTKGANSTAVSRVPLFNGGNDLAVTNEYLFVAMPGYGYAQFSLADPANPVLIKTFGAYGAAQGIEVSGNHVYVTHGIENRLVVYNVADPANPTIVGNLAIGKPVYGLDIYGVFAYIASGTEGLTVVDITDPSNLSIVGSLDTAGEARDVEVSGTTAYVADAGLWTVSVVNPTAPTTLGRYSASQGYAIQIINSSLTEPYESRYVAMSASSKGVYIFDTHDHRKPALRGRYEVGHAAYDMAVSGTMMMVGAGTGGFKYVDIEPVLYKVVFSQSVVNSRITFTRHDGKGTAIIQPFKAGQKVVAWKITTCKIGNPCPLYLAGLFAPTKPVTLKLYNGNGALKSSTTVFDRPTNGAHVRFLHQLTNNKVYIIVSPKAGQSTAKIYEVTSTGLRLMQTLTTAPAGRTGETLNNVFLLGGDREPVIVTAISGNGSSLKFWRYDSYNNRFLQDKSTRLTSLVALSGSRIIRK